MKVLDLQCNRQHVFEGWFASEADFQTQLEQGLVECPLCGDKSLTKKLSAPRLNLGATQAESAPNTLAPSGKSVATIPDHEIQAAWLQMVRHVVAHTEDVGSKFAEEARKIHYGEAGARGIRGQASREETQALLEEGIGVLPLPLPSGMTGPLQ